MSVDLVTSWMIISGPGVQMYKCKGVHVKVYTCTILEVYKCTSVTGVQDA